MCRGNVIKDALEVTLERNNKGKEKGCSWPDLILRQQFHHPQSAACRAEAPIVLVLGQLPAIVPEKSICSNSISCECIFPNVVTFLLPSGFCLGFSRVSSAHLSAPMQHTGAAGSRCAAGKLWRICHDRSGGMAHTTGELQWMDINSSEWICREGEKEGKPCILGEVLISWAYWWCHWHCLHD